MIKNVRGALPQVLEIIFEVWRSNEKNNKKENELSNLQNVFLFLTPPTFKPCNFLISFLTI
jgi:hypothetical protein